VVPGDVEGAEGARAGEAATPERTAAVRAGVSIARNSLWLTVDAVVGMGVSFYVSILAARHLGPDFMGRFNYILYFASCLRLVTEVAIPSAVRKFGAELNGRGELSMLKTIVSRALRLQARLAFVSMLVGLALVLKFFEAEQRVVATIAVVNIVPGLLLSVPTGALWATGNLRSNVLSSLCAHAVNFTGVTLSVLLGWGLVGITSSLLASRLADCTIRYTIFRREYAKVPGEILTGPLDPAFRARMVRFAWNQLALAVLNAVLFDRVEIFFLKRYAPTRDIAFFSISFTLVQYLLFLPQSLASSASVRAWTEQGRSPAEAARTTATATWFVLLLTTPELFGVSAISGPLMSLLYGSRYVEAIPVLRALSLFAVAVGLVGPTQLLLVGAERQRFYIGWLAACGLLGVAADLVLIPRYGAMGAAFAKGTIEVVACVGFLAYLIVHFRVSLPFARIARLLAACGAMYGVVRLVEARLPSLAALVVGVPVGAATFIVLVRLLRCLDGADRDRLRRLDRIVPGRARPAYLRVIDFVAPAGAA
jgi:O-antigen/teichoic acid export membrane protein